MSERRRRDSGTSKKKGGGAKRVVAGKRKLPVPQVNNEVESNKRGRSRLKQEQNERFRPKEEIHDLQARRSRPLSTASPEQDLVLSTREELSLAEEEYRRQNEELKNALELVEHERQRYQEVFDFAPDGYIVTDGSGVIQEANASAANLLNAPRALLMGKPFSLFLLKKERPGFELQLQSFRRDQRISDWEVIMLPRRKKAFPAAVTALSTNDAKGDQRIYWLLRDIFGRKQTEEILRQNEERHRNYFENSVMGTLSVDAKGLYTSINPAALKVLGYTLAEIIGTDSLKHVAPESRKEVLQAYAKVRKTREAIPNLRYNYLTKGGERRTLESSVNLITVRGKPVGFQATAIDITDRKHAEEILHLTYRFLQAANRHSQMKPLLNDFANTIKEFTGCEAIGIRVFDGNRRVSAQLSNGFPEDFFTSSCPVSTMEEWCLCRMAAEGSTGVFNFGGGKESAYGQGRADFAPRCKELQYQSVAAIPIRIQQRIIGLIQAAARSQQAFQERTVNVLEQAVTHIGTAIVRIQMNETVRQALELSHKKAAETSSLLEGSRAVLEHRNFKEAAKAIISSSRNIIGATAGCITVRKDDADYEEVVVLDSDKAAVADRGELKLPIGAARANVYYSAKTAFVNHPDETDRIDFHDPEFRKQNFLIAPLLLDGAAAGLLILFNKPDGFCEEDVRLADAFAGQAAVALRNSNYVAALQKSEARYRWLSEGLEATVRKKVAELQQVKTLASIGQMVSVVAHEIRNPLQNIYMGVDALRTEMGSEPHKREILEEITYGVGMLNGIVRELLDYSKPVNLSYSYWSIKDIVNNSLNLLSEKLSGVLVNKNLKDPDIEIFMDADKISRVIVNLLSNAAEAMPDGGTLTISSEFCAVEGIDYLKISISDTGCGIDGDTLARIEEPFFTTKTQGTGLGISICRKIIEAHKGTLQFKSRKNEGTTVDVFLPAKTNELV